MEVLRERPAVADLRDREVVPLVEVPVGRRPAEPEQRQGGAVEPVRLLEVGNADRDVVEHRSALVVEVVAVVDLEALGLNFAAQTFEADVVDHRRSLRADATPGNAFPAWRRFPGAYGLRSGSSSGPARRSGERHPWAGTGRRSSQR